jgi:hypothetical protein
MSLLLLLLLLLIGMVFVRVRQTALLIAAGSRQLPK